MRGFTHNGLLVLLAVLSAVAMAAVSISNSAATWAATAYIVGTTFVADPTESTYWHGATEYYVGPATFCGVQICSYEPVRTPEQFWPSTGWNDLTIDASIAQGTNTVDTLLRDRLAADSDRIVVFGDSQSSSILTMEKRNLAGLSPAEKSRLTFVLVANPNRPNGGLLERIAPFTVPILHLTGSGATPTDSGINTIDIAFQYDGIADFPRYPLNLVADLNVLVGANIHGSYMTGRNGYTEAELIDAINTPANRQTYGDTTYVTIPAKQLPLLVPLRQFGEAAGLSGLTTPLADLMEPTLRVIVELGYDRATPYGAPTRFALFPTVDPRELASDLTTAGAEGVSAALADLGRANASPATTATVSPPDRPRPPTSRAPRMVSEKTRLAAARTTRKTLPIAAIGATPRGKAPAARTHEKPSASPGRQASLRSTNRQP